MRLAVARTPSGHIFLHGSRLLREPREGAGWPLNIPHSQFDGVVTAITLPTMQQVKTVGRQR